MQKKLEEADVLHRQAMQLAQNADIHSARGGSPDVRLELLTAAFVAERKAAWLLLDAEQNGVVFEPSRSVLCRSAAALGAECGFLVSATDLVQKGLGGQPTDDVRHELEELRDEIAGERDRVRSVLDRAEDRVHCVASQYESGERRTGNALFAEALAALEHDAFRAAELHCRILQRVHPHVQTATLIDALATLESGDPLPTDEAALQERFAAIAG